MNERRKRSGKQNGRIRRLNVLQTHHTLFAYETYLIVGEARNCFPLRQQVSRPMKAFFTAGLLGLLVERMGANNANCYIIRNWGGGNYAL